MRKRLALLLFTALILVAAGCSETATDRDRDRVLAMIETLRPEVEAALGDSLGEIEVTPVGEPELKARVLATIRATSQEKLTRGEFEVRYARQCGFDMLGGQGDPATDVEGNLYFRALPSDDAALARNIEAALLRSYQVRTLSIYPFLRSASGAEQRELRYRFILRHIRFVRDSLTKSRGAARPLILPGAGSAGPRSLANRTSRISAAEFFAWESYLTSYLEKRYPDLSPAEAFKEVFANPPQNPAEVTGLDRQDSAYDLAIRASEALWPDLTVSVPTRVLPGVVAANFLTAGSGPSARAAGMVREAFEVNADHERGFVRILAFGTESGAAATELQKLWLEEERALDEACRPGTESEALLFAGYRDVVVGGCAGTLVQRIEEDRAFLGLEIRHQAWRRPERLSLLCGKNLLVVDLPYSLAFPTDTLGVARRILGEPDLKTWPEPPENDRVSALTAGLESTDPQFRWWSLDGLAGLLTEDDPGWVILAPTLREERPHLLARSLAALGTWLEYVQFPLDDILPLLIRFCSHGDPEVRANAYRCLSHLESSEQGAEDALFAGLSDPVASVRFHALRTWAGNWTEANPPPFEAVSILIRMAKDPVNSVSRSAAANVKLLDATGTAAVPQLIEALKADVEILRKAAARALRKVGDNSPEVIAALQSVYDEDWSEMVTEEAWWSLKTLTGKNLRWTDRFTVGE